MLLSRTLRSGQLLRTFCYSKTKSTRTMSRVGSEFEDEAIQGFLQDIHKVLVNEALVQGTNRDTKVVEFKQPEELKSLLDLHIDEGPTEHGKLLDLCSRVVKYSVKTGNTGFYNQLYSGINAYGLSGAWITEALNTNMHTYEVAPAFIIIEKYMVEKLCQIIGYKNGDGIFGPGGSFTNIMSLNLARYKCHPDFKNTGMYGLKHMKMYTSAESHYSAVKGAVFLGMGSDNVVKVKTDERGRVIPEDLEKKIKADIEKGNTPMFMMATAGTTVLGAYDPLNPIADICEKYGLWLHCDACWGGGALLSPKYKHLMAGIDRTDSVSWNLHKMTAAPLQCSALLVKHNGILESCNKSNAEYLFQPDKCYDVAYDIGDKTVQCGRKVDSLKIWYMWKALGDSGMTSIVENLFDNARYLTEQLKITDGFKIVIPEYECTNICFWYIPESLRGQEETPEWWEKVAKVAPKIKERMMYEGTLLIGYQPLTVKGFVNFFRIIIGNARCEHADMDFVIKEIDRLGRDL